MPQEQWEIYLIDFITTQSLWFSFYLCLLPPSCHLRVKGNNEAVSLSLVCVEMQQCLCGDEALILSMQKKKLNKPNLHSLKRGSLYGEGVQIYEGRNQPFKC